MVPELPEDFGSELDEFLECFRCFGASSFWQKVGTGARPRHGMPWSTFEAEIQLKSRLDRPGARNASFGDRAPSFWWPMS